MRNKQRKKRAFTLMELLVASMLFTMLLVVMFSVFRQFAHFHNVTKSEYKEAEAHRIVHAKLKYIFSNATHTISKGHAFFLDTAESTDNPSLFVTFNNGVDHDTYFSEFVLGKLYVDKDDNFCLAYWKMPEKKLEDGQEEAIFDRDKMRHEILLPNVERISYAFFPITEKEDTPKAFEWVDKWEMDWNMRPAIITITITLPNEKPPLEFRFVFMQQRGAIPYKVKEVNTP